MGYLPILLLFLVDIITKIITAHVAERSADTFSVLA